jgi:uncharacterized protein (TIGR03118 family)
MMQASIRGTTLALSAGLLTFASLAAHAAPVNDYVVTRLVSDQAGKAQHLDKQLVNAWGIASAPGSPFWVNDNGTGVSTLYDGNGVKQPLVVTIPSPHPGAVSAPTGMVWNPTTDFVFQGWAQIFLFDSEDGTISGWFSSDGTKAKTIVNNSKRSAIYKGLALGAAGGKNYLYATNFHAGKVEVYNGNFARATLAGDFSDPAIPAGFAPFGIANIGGALYVTYATQDADKHDDVPGPGNGFVNIFDTQGRLLKHFVQRGHLNSPWGVVRAPKGFGRFSGAILIGNFGNGQIHAYGPNGGFLGTLRNDAGKPVTIGGLWGLTFGGAKNAPIGTLYITAGPGGEAHGLFGSIAPK